MKLKLDENVDIRIVPILRLAGHDVETVRSQRLNSASDVELINICRSEERCLVTADRGFGNRMRFPPLDYSGIVLVRLPSSATFADWREAVDTLILGLEQAEVMGKLWIIQGERLQEYQSIEEK